METFKTIMIWIGIAINLGFYTAFFTTFCDESVSETTNLLILIAALIMTMLIKQDIVNFIKQSDNNIKRR